LVQTTQRYCPTCYVFVSRADRKLHLVSIKDLRLRQLKSACISSATMAAIRRLHCLYQASPHLAAEPPI
jgi:hypothetical protein